VTSFQQRSERVVPRPASPGPSPAGARYRRPGRAAEVLLACIAISFAAQQPALAGSLSRAMPAHVRSDGHASARRLLLQAERGNPRAQAMLGFMYANGRGVPQNYVVAVHWYVGAAEQGDPTAQYLLGLMYDKGQGVPRDDTLAHMWLNLAAAHAGPRERESYLRIRDAVATKMSAVQIANAQWLAYRWRPQR
jgi:uncharacterized protein